VRIDAVEKPQQLAAQRNVSHNPGPRGRGRSTESNSRAQVAQAFAGSMRSTKSARHAGASNGLAKYSVIFAILPSRISPIPT